MLEITSSCQSVRSLIHHLGLLADFLLSAVLRLALPVYSQSTGTIYYRSKFKGKTKDYANTWRTLIGKTYLVTFENNQKRKCV